MNQQRKRQDNAKESSLSQLNSQEEEKAAIPPLSLDFQEHLFSFSSYLPQILFPKQSTLVHISQSRNTTINNYHVPYIESHLSVKPHLGGDDISFVNLQHNAIGEKELESVGNQSPTVANSTTNPILKHIIEECKETAIELEQFLHKEIPHSQSNLESEIDQLQKELREDSILFEKSLIEKSKKRKLELEKELQDKIEQLNIGSLVERIAKLKIELQQEKETYQSLQIPS